MWVVRHQSNELSLFISMKPERGNAENGFDGWYFSPEEAIGYPLNSDKFGDVKWGDEPVEVDLIRYL